MNDMTEEQKKIERMYKRALRLSDRTPTRIGGSTQQAQYASEYRRIYNNNPSSIDVKLFRLITRGYRTFLRNSSF